MKRIVRLFLILVVTLTLAGCSGLVNNEIYNKSYDVGEISLKDFEDLVVAVVEKAEGSVLGVSNYERVGLQNEPRGVGSGFVYKTIAIMKDGTQKEYSDVINSNDVRTFKYYLVTNRHVVVGDGYTPSLRVYFGDEDKEVNATLVQFDDQVDLAVVTFEHTTLVKPVQFADSDKVKKGSFAVAIGSPSGYEFYGSATFGVISHPKRYVPEDSDKDGVSEWDAEYIQHDVAINPGNSGGPLINMEGKIIGINTMKFVSDDIDNMGFSIPSNLAVQIIELLEQGIKPKRAKLGVEVSGIRDMTEATRLQNRIPEDFDYGFYVGTVIVGGVAEIAGIQKGDIIMSFNKVSLKYSHELRIEINKFTIGSGDKCEVEVYRNGEYITMTIVF
jgi:serine protease Do